MHDESNLPTPLITLGITSYNSEKTIQTAIDSAINQSWVNKEIIIVDDCSSDSSVDIIKSCDYKDIPVYTIFKNKNEGFPSALNSIISCSKGDYIAFFDDDDFSLPERIHTQFLAISNYIKSKNIKKVVCFASRKRTYSNGYVKYLPAIGSRLMIPVGNDIVNYHLNQYRDHSIFFGSGTPTCSLFIPKSAFQLVGLYDISLKRTEDCDLAIRLGKSKFHFIGCSQTLVVQSATYKKSNSPLRNYISDLKLFKKYKDLFPSYQSYMYILLWSRMKSYYLSSSYYRAFVVALRLFVNFPIKFCFHFLYRAPIRFIHDLNIGLPSSFFPFK